MSSSLIALHILCLSRDLWALFAVEVCDLEAAQHTYTPAVSVHGWPYTSCTGALWCMAQSAIVTQLEAATCPPMGQHTGPYLSMSEWVSSVLRSHQHSIGYMGDGFYRSKDPTNSIKILKEMLQKRKKTTKTTKYTYTLCPNKSDPLADFLIACNKIYRIKHNFMNTYPYVLQTITQSFWKIPLSVTQKSNCKQNRINVWLYNYWITTCSSQSYNDNV